MIQFLYYNQALKNNLVHQQILLRKKKIPETDNLSQYAISDHYT